MVAPRLRLRISVAATIDLKESPQIEGTENNEEISVKRFVPSENKCGFKKKTGTLCRSANKLRVYKHNERL